MTFQRKAVKLYTNPYKADILISSPLALRMMVGAQGYGVATQTLKP